MPEYSEEYTAAYLPIKEANGILISHLSWKRIYGLAGKSSNESS